MCGIFGLRIKKSNVSFNDFVQDTKLLYKISEVRGQDSTGIAILTDENLHIFRRITKPRNMLDEVGFNETLKTGYYKSTKYLNYMGHCRLTTNGSYSEHDNNQPIVTDLFVGIHNGIVLNAEELAGVEKLNLTTREHFSEPSDTKLFFSKINELYQKNNHLPQAISSGFNLIEGSASIGIIDNWGNIILGTNTGSLYYLVEKSTGNFLFASERFFLKKFLKHSKLFDEKDSEITQLLSGNGMVVNQQLQKFNFKEKQISKQIKLKNDQVLKKIEFRPNISQLKRCTKCILPETYPFISFDKKGVCNFCSRHENQKFHGEKKLEELLAKYRSKDGRPDCLIGLSGGRDSGYGIYILKEKFGMHPILYTYDWGLTTDISRRNQAKIIGKLGLEHILRSADIQKKREFIFQNINAWLKKPHLGMVPLFMAGDKEFYQLGRKLRKELNLKLTIFCSGQLLEQREFFVGFCGVNQNVTKTARTYHYNFMAKVQLAFFYISQYIKNPFYINKSFFDSIRSFFTTFLFKDDFLYLYEYLPWDEKEIESVLKREFDWEIDKSYGKNQWRMGDGQTAFTNFIYFTLAGFTEFDNFRSNQIREGLITREEAIELVRGDNRPKIETLQYFSYLIGFNLDEVLARINTIPKLY